MGNSSCCGKTDPQIDYRNIDEYYDPFRQLRSKVVLDESVKRKHGPANANFLTTLPKKLIKTEDEMADKFPETIKLRSESYLLRNMDALLSSGDALPRMLLLRAVAAGAARRLRQAFLS